MVDIAVPIYKETPENDDLVALAQLFRILGSYPITFIHPKSLNIKNYWHYRAGFKAFEDCFFQNIHSYNRLMLSSDFYKAFTRKYILIYQTDCLVFKDELMKWCEKDYDYIGAPWLGSRSKVPLIKFFYDRTISYVAVLMDFRGNGRTQKDKSLLYNAVGNGGLSLRKREKFIEVLENLSDVVKIYLNPKNTGKFYAEDVFFSIEPKRNNLMFTKPDYAEACEFAVENKPEKALGLIGGLPFGCHRWNKENTAYWEKILKQAANETF